MADFAQYIGIPFKEKGRDPQGFDCWGICREILSTVFHIDVPSYTEDYVTTKEGSEISALIGCESLGWSEVTLSHAQPGDVLVLRMRGRPWHCALFIDPPWFIHADPKAGVVRERWDSIIWEKRISEIYRHPLQVERVAVGSTVQ